MLESVWRKGNPLHCWWECKLVQPLWRPVWRFLKKLEIELPSVQFSSVQSLSRVWLFATPWMQHAMDRPPCPSPTPGVHSNSCIKSVMPSSHLILCHPLLLLPPIPPSIRGFSNESTLRVRWPKYWSFSLSISPSSEYPGLVSFWMDWLDLLAVQVTLKSLLWNCHTTQQSHCRAYTLRKPELKETCVLQCSSQHCLQ